MSRKSSTNRSGTSNPFANADSSPFRTIASGTTRSIACAEHRHEAQTGGERKLGVAALRGRVEDHDRLDQRGALLGKRGCDTAAHRVAHDVGAPHAEAVEGRRDEPRLALHPVTLLRLLRAAVPEQVEPDHVVVARERGRHLVPPADRAGEAVQHHDGGGVPRAVLTHLEVATRQVDDAPGVGARRLGVAIRHDRVHREQRRRAPPAGRGGRDACRNAIRSGHRTEAGWGTARRKPRAPLRRRSR